MTVKQGINKKQLVIAIAIPLLLGVISGLLTMNGAKEFSSVNQPALSPPAWLFPVAWTILYTLMGISSYLIYSSGDENSKNALIVYALSLAVNITWPFFFFNFEAYLFSFIWLLILWVLVAVTIFLYWKINKPAALLQIPYILWLTFAAYLNFGVYVLN